MTRHARVNEDQLGQYSRCVNAIADRLGKSLAFECVMAALQRIHDGQFGTGSRIICIDRSLPFDSAEFIGKDWGVIEEDERSVALTEVDLSSVRLETCLRAERYIPGETRLCRLKEAGYIRLDAKVFETLWRNQHLIPEGWKEKTYGYVTHVYFDGTLLRSPQGDRCVLCLYWLSGEWSWRYNWLGNDWEADNPSAVIASLVSEP